MLQNNFNSTKETLELLKTGFIEYKFRFLLFLVDDSETMKFIHLTIYLIFKS